MTNTNKKTDKKNVGITEAKAKIKIKVHEQGTVTQSKDESKENHSQTGKWG
jgi:hypothetical protein